MKYILILLLVFASCNSKTNQFPSPLTYKYEPEVYEFTGTLVEREFWGAPSYGESPEKDTKEKFLILALEKPINIIATEEEVGENLQNVDSLQLLGAVGKLKVKIDQKIKLKGKLVASISAHHHTPALLEIIN